MDKFSMENDVGIMVTYTILGISDIGDGKEYVIYTNYMPSDNPVHYRLMAREIVDLKSHNFKRIPLKLEKEIVTSFINQLVTSGKKIRPRR